ncbi:hypothetical protein LTR48_004056 [Friedmanniomyces endolithicus]|nr:hypothetical protein LTR48_004056 [Friedmanniomyces endolithicus]
MAGLLQAIDRASGATDENGRTVEDEASVWAQAMSEQWGGKMDVRDVQERWIERKEERDEVERKQWEDEARLAGALPEQSAAKVVRRHVEERGAEFVGNENDLVEEQRRWEGQRAEGTGEAGGGGPKIVRKG